MAEAKKIVETLPRRYLNVPDAARYLTLSKEYIYLLVKAKTIPFSRIGKRLVFSIPRLDEWLSKQERPRSKSA